MKKLVFSVLLTAFIGATSFAQEKKAVLKKADLKKTESATVITPIKVKDASKSATGTVVGLTQEQQDAETLKLKKAGKTEVVAKTKPAPAAETVENAGQ
jgi:hypothetical protein